MLLCKRNEGRDKWALQIHEYPSWNTASVGEFAWYFVWRDKIDIVIIKEKKKTVTLQDRQDNYVKGIVGLSEYIL